MPSPTINQVHTDRPLTDLSIAYLQNGTFVAPTMFPVVPVRNMSDKYYIWTKADFLRSQAQKRASGAAAARIGVNLSTSTYTCERDAAAYPIPDPDRANADAGVDLERTAVEVIMRNIMMAVEVDFASTFFTTGVWTGSSTATDITPGTLWDVTSSTPIEDIRAQILAIEENTGYKPNVLLFGAQAWSEGIVDHPDVIDRLKGGATSANPAVVNEATIAGILGLERIVVARATRNTAAEGVAGTYDFILGQNDALLCYAAPSPGLRVPSAGYTFRWNVPGGANGIEAIKRYRDEENESDIIEGGLWYDHVATCADLGAFFSNVVS